MTPPYGIADAASVKLTAVDGTRVAICNDVLNVTGSLNVKAGIPVTIIFSARQVPLE